MNLSKLVFYEYEGRDLSIYATSEIIDNFIDTYDIELENEVDYRDCIERRYALLSRVKYTDGCGWFIDKLPTDKSRQLANMCDVMLVEKELSEECIIDYHKIIFNEMYLFEEDTEMFEENTRDIEEYENDWLDDITEDLLYELVNLEDDECPHCILKRYLTSVYNSAKEDVVNDIINYLDN